MRSIVLLASLSLLMFQENVARATTAESNVTCPSDDLFGGIDDAHLLIQLPEQWDYAKFVRKILGKMQETRIEKLQRVEFLEKVFGRVIRPVFSYRTGQIRNFPSHQEELVEFVVVRPLDDCTPIEVQHSAGKSFFVVSRAFTDNSLNLALVGFFLEHGIPMQALSPLGRSWICTNQMGHPNCVQPEL